MLTRDVTDGVLKLSSQDREELAAVLVESLRDEPGDVEEEIDLDTTAQFDDVDSEAMTESAASQL